MKTKNVTKIIPIIICAGMLMLGGCRKKDTPVPDPEPEPVDTEQSTASDNQIAEMIASDVESIGGQTSDNDNTSQWSALMRSAACSTVTSNLSARMYTVDFGTAGCVGPDGKTRKGKLFFDCSASAQSALFYRNPGFVMNVTSQNYEVDSYSVTIINKTVQNTTPMSIPSGTNPGTNLTWSVSANVSVMKPGNTGTVTWSCNRTKELMNTSDPTCYRGQGTQHIVWSKAIVRLNGTASGTNAKGESFTSVATNLERDFGCKPDGNRPNWSPFIGGTLAYTPGNRPTRTINYGTGVCDVNATITVANTTFSIVLP
jgi:hypothetical protein